MWDFNWRLIPYSVNDDTGLGKNYIYAPHPFTNWSLNPGHRSPLGEKLHTIEGFRKTAEYESIVEYFKMNADKKKVYCLGGSTTYCNELLPFDAPWPSRLRDKLSKHLSDVDCVVANAGVGGWNTLQSLIRFVSWAPILKPDLVIVCQSKNDLGPLYNGDINQKLVFPDYSNVMGQFSQSILEKGMFTRGALWRANGGVGSVYGPSWVPSAKGLARFDENLVSAVVSRYEAICAIAKAIGARVLFVPELIQGSPYYPFMKILHRKMHDVAKKYDHCDFIDLSDIVPHEEQYFWDKMHFTEEGCELFADILAQLIARKGLLRS